MDTSNQSLKTKLKQSCLSVDKFLKRLPVPLFIILMTGAGFLIRAPTILLSIFYSRLSGDVYARSGPRRDRELAYQIIVFFIIGPLIETFLNQWLVIKSLRKVSFFKERNFSIVLLSAITFGLMHTYDALYVVNTFFIGLVLAYAFVIYEKKESSPYRVVCAIHACLNICASIIFRVFG